MEAWKVEFIPPSAAAAAIEQLKEDYFSICRSMLRLDRRPDLWDKADEARRLVYSIIEELQPLCDNTSTRR